MGVPPLWGHQGVPTGVLVPPQEVSLLLAYWRSQLG